MWSTTVGAVDSKSFELQYSESASRAHQVEGFSITQLGGSLISRMCRWSGVVSSCSPILWVTGKSLHIMVCFITRKGRTSGPTALVRAEGRGGVFRLGGEEGASPVWKGRATRWVGQQGLWADKRRAGLAHRDTLADVIVSITEVYSPHAASIK